MAVLSWLKGRKPGTAANLAITGSGGMQFLSLGNFYGRCEASPNGRFTLAWRDGDGQGHGGARS